MRDLNDDETLVVLILLASICIGLLIVTEGISLIGSICFSIGMAVSLALAIKIAIEKQNNLFKNEKRVED